MARVPTHMKQLATLPLFHKVFLGVVVAVGIYMIVFRNKVTERFNTRRKFKVVRGNEIYDPLYVGMYDSLLVRKSRLDHEVDEIMKKTQVTSESRILDVGSATGHRCGMLSELGTDCVGFEQSEAMIAKASEEYPDIQFVQGDAGAPNHNYYNRFSQILCMYFTFYEIENQAQFLKNCVHWLRPGGYLVIHLVDVDKLDPILPVGDVLLSVNPQDYAEEKITTTRAVFENKDYKSQFKSKGKNRYALVETITDRENGSVRRNEHELRIPSAAHVTELAKQAGLVLMGGEEMEKCGYVGQYIYIFQKPS